ncbi:antA/AntB antirepressor family protein [Sporolactobacillus shoreicorticis]|uniref:AntA/AntB antirepressor family protein n=1 Tax=Sporolactobacillus shoreicorticis TaxID=1923877 RepID=A0ABW5RZ86_9BACL|nr:antA/AntB antirepressor family protein [Sporolactobacillus shoreicorticis]MCO7125079.1 antA/AntB antirepressor family protein [Sporolactobacillus shoreicorticis]
MSKNELIPMHENESGDILISGRELHEFLEVGTRYDIWFERMADYGFVENQDFVAVDQKRTTAQGNATTFKDHHLKLDMAKEIAMIQRTEKGKMARQYFLKLERLWNSPEMVMKRALKFANQRVEQLRGQMELDKPFTQFGKQVSNSNAAIPIGSFAKEIHDKQGIKIGRNNMFAWLRDRGYLIKSGREKNNPVQRYIDQGLFVSKPTIISRPDGDDLQRSTTLITGKGQVRVLDELLAEKKAAADG